MAMLRTYNPAIRGTSNNGNKKPEMWSIEWYLGILEKLIDLNIIKTDKPPETMTAAEVKAIVDAAFAAQQAKPWYEEYAPWIVAGVLGIGLLIAVLKK